MRNFSILTLVLFSSYSFSAIYTWKDENGKKHFSDKKPSDSSYETANIQHTHVSNKSYDATGNSYVKVGSSSKDRDDASFYRAIEQHVKPKFYMHYSRELRKNPKLQGNIKFKITISPAGNVINASIVKSELKSESFNTKLLSVIKSIKFEPQNVKETTKYWAADFLPT